VGLRVIGLAVAGLLLVDEDVGAVVVCGAVVIPGRIVILPQLKKFW
jgi:hypothetical protein